AIRPRPRGNAAKFGKLRFLGCDNQLAAFPVGKVPAFKIIIELRAAFHAKTCLQASSGIVDARMDHLAVARRCFRADSAMPFESKRVMSRPCERPRTGKAHYARADNNGFD